jgi:hypothetical protein
MSAADIVAVLVLIAGGASPTRQGFGTPALAAYFNPATHWQNSGDRVRYYPTASALTMLVADGFLPTGVVYRAFEAACSQSPAPPTLALLRRALPPTQILKLTFSDVVVGDKYALTIMGTGGIATSYTMPSTGVPATDAASFAALLTALLIGTVSVSTNVITITQIAGSLTDISAWTTGNIAINDATVDPGITTDLAAIAAAGSTGWYSLSLDSNSLQEVKAAASWVEATGQGGHWGFFNSSDAPNCAASASPVTDLNGELEALSLMKCHLAQSNSQVLSVAGFALASLVTAMQPGSYQVAMKTIAGVVADTDQTLTETQALILNTASTSQPGTGGKNGNYYKTVSGLNLTWPGVTPGGRWVDQGIFCDWLQNNVQADVLAYLAGLPAVPLTDIGIAGFAAVIKSRLKIGASPPFGGIDGSRPIVVNVPLAANMSPADRNARNLSGVTATFFFSGAILSTEMIITGTP